MLVRLVIWIFLACVGFAGGRVCFRGEELAAGVGEKTSLASWAATQPTALAGGAAGGGGAPSESELVIEEVRRAAGLDLGAAMLGYLRVVEETPLDGLEALLMESEKTMPETDIGGVGVLMRDAIVARLMAEDPDRLLLMVAANKSSHLSGKTSSIMEELLELKGYDAINAALAETQYPLGAARAMRELRNRMDSDDLREKLALEDSRLAPYQYARHMGSEQVIDLIVKDGVLTDLDPRHIKHWFGSFYVSDPEGALSKLGELPSASYRMSALEGIAQAWKNGEFAEVKAFAEGLESDQMRLAFLRGVLPSMQRRVDPLGGAGVLVAANSNTLSQILELDQGPVRQTLLEDTLGSWKLAEPEQARAWSEANGVLDTFEKMISRPGLPLRTNAIDGLLDPPADDEG